MSMHTKPHFYSFNVFFFTVNRISDGVIDLPVVGGGNECFHVDSVRFF